jgi:VPDSG-CTERM motif
MFLTRYLGYTQYTFNVTASNASTALRFSFGGRGQQFLDDISVTPAGVPDGGSTVSLLGCALLGVAVLRRKLRC